MTTVAEPDYVSILPALPLTELPLRPPAATTAIPSKAVRPLEEHYQIPSQLGFVLEAAQADIGENSPPRISRLRTPFGNVVIAQMRVNTAMTVPAPFNLRHEAERKSEINRNRRAGKPWYPDFPAIVPAPHNLPGCVLDIDSMDQLDFWLRWERGRLASPSFKERLARDGIQEALLVLPTMVRLPTGEFTWALMALDGSRRVTNALDVARDILHVDPLLALLHWRDEAGREFKRDDVRDVRRQLLYPGVDLEAPLFPSSNSESAIAEWTETASEEAVTFQRTRSADARIVVGFEPFEGLQGFANPSVVDAVYSLLRRQHIPGEKPVDWEPADNRMVIGSRIVEALRDDEPAALDGLASEVFAGRIPLSDARLPDGRQRFRDELHAFATLAAHIGACQQWSSDYRIVYDTMSLWGQSVSPKNRALIAAEVGVPILGIESDEGKQVSAAVAGLLVGKEFRNQNRVTLDGRTWHDLIDEDVSTIRSGALGELGNNQTGPWSLALGILGGLALIINPDATSSGKSWTRLTVTGRGGLASADNKRNPEAIILDMLKTAHGHELLGEAAAQVSNRLAGARSEPVRLEIRVPGKPPVPMTEAALREEWVGPKGIGGTPPRPDQVTEYDSGLQDVLAQSMLLEELIERLEGLTDAGQLIFDNRGINKDQANVLRHAAEQLTGFATLGLRISERRTTTSERRVLDDDLVEDVEPAEEFLADEVEDETDR